MKLELNIQPLNTWINIKNEPLIISGPCSAETEDQLLSTAHLLKATGKVSILRAGIWKKSVNEIDMVHRKISCTMCSNLLLACRCQPLRRNLALPRNEKLNSHRNSSSV